MYTSCKFLFILLLLPAITFAQSNYKPGYVIMLNGDTVKGFIDYREWNRNPLTVNFKKDFASPQKAQYTPKAISEFDIYGLERFKSFAGLISQDKIGDNSSISTGVDTTKTQDTVFLRVINAGNPLTLLAFRDVKKERFFIGENDNAPKELIYHEYIKFDNEQEKNVINQQRAYRYQLKRLATIYQPQNLKLGIDIEKANYEETALSEIVNQINSAGSVYSNSTSQGGSRYFAGFAVNSSEISFSQDNIGLRNSSGTSIFPKINIGADIFVNKNVGTVIFRTELSITGNHANINGSTSESNYTDNETMKFNQYVLSLNPQILYNFYNTDKTKFYIAGGGALNYNTYSNKSYIVNFYYGVGANDPVSRSFPNVQALNFNLTAKVGCELNKRFNIYAGYSPKSRINNDLTYEMYLSSYYAGINYLFSK